MTGLGPSKAAVAVMPGECWGLQTGESHRALIHTASTISATTSICRQTSADSTSQSIQEPSQLHYQLQVSKPLPSIDLSRTLADLCSPKWRARIVAFMSSYYKYISMTHRVASLLYFLVLILPPCWPRHAITFLVVFSIFTLTCTSLFLSLDILKLLVRTPDVLFITMLNLLNWGCLAAMLGDLRAIVCIPSLYATQVGIFMDANFRTYPTVLRSILASIPAVLSVALCCALDRVYHPNLRVIRITRRSISLANVITYTSITISIFMAKKAFHKYKGSHTSFPGFHAIQCVMLRAKMKLAVFRSPIRQRHQLSPIGSNSMINQHLQDLRLSQSTMGRIDTLSCLLPPCIGSLSELHLATPLSWWQAALLYTTGLIGFAGVVTQSFLLSKPNTSGPVVDFASSVALVCSTTFCCAVATHLQQDLVHRLTTNFDFVFASIQVIVAAICVADMNDWQGSACTGIFTWVVWFLWMLTLDALTPAMRRRLRLRDKLILPVQCVLLMNTAWMLTQIFTNYDIGSNNRVLFQYRISSKQNYRLTTVSILVERLVTILGWCGSRIIASMLFGDHDELVFIRGMVEYMSPFKPFPRKPASVTTTQQANSGSTRR